MFNVLKQVFACQYVVSSVILFQYYGQCLILAIKSLVISFCKYNCLETESILSPA